MAKPKRRFACGSVSYRWQGQCADCGKRIGLAEASPIDPACAGSGNNVAEHVQAQAVVLAQVIRQLQASCHRK